MSQPRDSRLSFAKYSGHPTFSSIHPSAVEKITVKHLRALVWYHATTAGTAKKAAARVVDPRRWKRAQLLEHARTVLNGHIRQVASPDMDVIMTQYHRESADDALVQTLLASVVPAPSRLAAGVRNVDRNERAEGEEAGFDSAQSDLEAVQGEEGDDLEEDEEGEAEEVEDEKAAEEFDDREEVPADDADDAPVHRPPPRQLQHNRPPTGPARLVATAPRAGAKGAVPTSTTSKPTSTRLPQSSRSYEKRLAHCIACTVLNDVTDHLPSFCSTCGNPWGIRPDEQSATTEGPGTSTTTTAPTTPTTWAGAATFKAKPVSASVPAAHHRAPGLAPLDEKIIRHAREGKQHYTLADLLQLRAEDRSSTSSVVLNESAILFDPREGTLTSAVGAAATSARSAAARRRAITGFAEIAEAMLFSLIGTIYVDRPDIGQQLLGLLIIAQDLTRAFGWLFALDYVERVRYKFHDSVGGPHNRHCLLIDSQYDMGTRDMEALLDTKLLHHPPTQKENSNPNRREAGDGKSRQKSTDTCRGWNNGTCTRKSADCKFAHRCSSCNSSDHSAQRCSARTAQGGSTTPVGAPPASATGRGT